MTDTNIRKSIIPLSVIGMALFVAVVLSSKAVWRAESAAPSPSGCTPSCDMINVKSYGAKGDGIADDTNAIQSALNAAASKTIGKGGTVFMPAGKYKVTKNLVIPANAQSLMLKGAGASSAEYDRGTWLMFTGGGILQQNIGDITYQDFAVRTDAGAGPAFDLNNINHTILNNVAVVSGNPGQSLIRGRTTLIGLYIQNFTLTPAGGYTASAIDLQSGIGSLNNVTIEKGVIHGNNTGHAPLILMDGLGSAAATNNTIKEIDFETPVAGAIRWRSIQRSAMMNLWAGDVTIAPTAPLIDIDKSAAAGAQSSNSLLLTSIESDFGTTANPTLFFNGDVGGQGEITVIGSRLPVISNNGPNANRITLINCVDPVVVGDPPIILP